MQEFAKYATLSVTTGAVYMQTWLSPDECRKLASMLLDVAVDLQKQINAMEPPKSQNKRFTFYVEGVGIEVSAVAESQKAAHQIAWNSLTEAQRNAAACLDCIDTEEVAA